MRKTQADTSLGGLLIRKNTWEGISEEEFRTVNFVEPRGFSTFDYLKFLISEFVVNGKSINRDLYFKVYFESLEKLIRNPGAKVGKGKISYYLTKYPWDFIYTNPELAREVLISIDRFDRILINKRAQGSEKWKSMRKIRLVIERRPGIQPHEFPPVRYIGVGYRDKGSSRVKSYDGQPSWQEVASCRREVRKQQEPKPIRDLHLDRLRSDLAELRQRQLRLLRKRRREKFSWL